MAKRKLRILIADDHAIVRSGLRALFQRNPEFSIVGEASDGEQAIAMTMQYKPDVAILDISMPVVNGLEATRAIKQQNSRTKVLILTIHDEEEYIYEVVQAKADGYVLKNADKQEIMTAVRSVTEGKTFFSPAVSRTIIDGFIHKGTLKLPSETTHQQLTKREKEILSHLAQGLSSKEIANKVFLSVSTVNTHRCNIMKKLNIHDTAGLVRYALQTHLIKL